MKEVTIDTIFRKLKHSGIDKGEVASKIGISQGYLSNIISNTKPVTKNFIETFLSEYIEHLNSSEVEFMYSLIRIDGEPVKSSYMESRMQKKLGTDRLPNIDNIGVPIYDIPIDASFLERYRDDGANFEPMYFLNIPKLRNCDFGAIVSGSSMYPVMKSGTLAICRVIDKFDYFDAGEMYFITTTNGFETVKYVQQSDENTNELKLIPHNEKIKPTFISKDMVIKMCIVEAWLNFR